MEEKNVKGTAKEGIMYLIFGVLTTLVSIFTYWLFSLFIKNELLANAIALAITILFAFVTNKLFVFDSKSWSKSQLASELPSFLGARLISALFEELGMLLFVVLLGFGEFSTTILGFEITGGLIVKTILTFIVIVLNYFFSKFFVFKKEKGKTLIYKRKNKRS